MTPATLRRPPGDPRTSRAAFARYIGSWLAMAPAAAALGVLVVRAIEPSTTPFRRSGTAKAGGCIMRVADGPAAQASRPPLAGPAAKPARDGAYRAPLPTARVVGALRRGSIAIVYRLGLPASQMTILDRRFAGQRRRIVAPDGSGMGFAVAATAWHRLIGCRRVNGRSVAVLADFAARYQGRGTNLVP